MSCRREATYTVNGSNEVACFEVGAQRWRREAQRGAGWAVRNMDNHKSHRQREESNDEPNAARRAGAGSVRSTDGAGVGKRQLEHCVLTSVMHDGPDGLGQTGEGRPRTIDANCDDCARRLRLLGTTGDGVVGE
jgi:hypothetical protein